MNFTSTRNSGFVITFANGVSASVQWGAGCHGDNFSSHDTFHLYDASSSTAEVAAYIGDFSNCITDAVTKNSDGEIAIFLTPEEVADFLSACANYKA